MAEDKPRVMAGTDRLLTAQELAKILRVSKSWVRDHTTRYEPRIPALQMGSRWLYRASEIENWLSGLGIKKGHAA